MVDRLIKLFVMESKKNLRTVDLSNWVGKVYIGNRKHVDLIQEIPDLAKSTGLYFLLGRDPESDDSCLYIGEADDVANRIKQHANNKEKEWFDEFIVFVSKDMDLTKAHVRYLEKSFYDLAKENLTTINLMNSCCPPGSNLSDCDIAYMQEFQNNILFILNHLGLINFVKTTEKKVTEPEKFENIFYINLKKENKDKQAKLAITDNGYVLLKGTYIEKYPNPSFLDKSNMKKRQQLLEKGLLQELDNVVISTEDIYFNSPSGAANIVRLNATNGWLYWKLPNGITFDEFERK